MLHGRFVNRPYGSYVLTAGASPRPAILGYFLNGVIIMKCESCGKRLKKSDEICPECGRFIGRTVTSTEEKPEIFASADSVCNENEIVFKDNIPLLIFKLVVATVFTVMCFYTFFEGMPSDFRDFILIGVSIFTYGEAFYVFANEKGCKLTFENDRIHGIVPGGKHGKKEIDVRYDEILKAEFVMGSKYSPSHISILLRTGDEVKIPCTRKKTLTEIEERIQERLNGMKVPAMNATVIYHGETVEGSLINGKEYILVEIGEDGMYEVIDESGESGFFYPESFERI